MQVKDNQVDIHVAVKAIKTAILKSQYNAAKTVNKEQISLYYGIGRYISSHTRTGYWGTGAIERISQQLQRELPGLRGFGVANLKFMRQFYEAWNNFFPETRDKAESLTMVSDFEELHSTSSLLSVANRYLTVSDLNAFLSIGFTHHIIILRHTKDLEERLFYIRQTILNKWNKYQLEEMVKSDFFHHQNQMPNNFSKSIPSANNALRAIEMFKDEYLLDFINVEEIGARDEDDVDERVVEKSIINNVKNFIMTFGRDFTFVGNQYHLEKYGHSVYPDLLFYNRELAALVCVELKRGDFKPAYLGQLSAYLRILDSEVKKPFENPSIGIILCKRADKSFVEFLIQGYDNPMGVATYKTKEDVRKVLPSEEDLLKVMDGEDFNEKQPKD